MIGLTVGAIARSFLGTVVPPGTTLLDNLRTKIYVRERVMDVTCQGFFFIFRDVTVRVTDFATFYTRYLPD